MFGQNVSDTLKLESINAQITYLSDTNSDEYISKIIKDYGHNISHGNNISILISGIKESTILELVSNKSLKCSRLTTSKTLSAHNPLYCVNEHNREFTKKFLKLRNEFIETSSIKDKSDEKLNEFSLETKALSIVIHCELYDLYKYCNKKINNPYEYELKDVCTKILKEISSFELIKILTEVN